jgi:hypothetical protein
VVKGKKLYHFGGILKQTSSNGPFLKDQETRGKEQERGYIPIDHSLPPSPFSKERGRGLMVFKYFVLNDLIRPGSGKLLTVLSI